MGRANDKLAGLVKAYTRAIANEKESKETLSVLEARLAKLRQMIDAETRYYEEALTETTRSESELAYHLESCGPVVVGGVEYACGPESANEFGVLRTGLGSIFHAFRKVRTRRVNDSTTEEGVG